MLLSQEDTEDFQMSLEFFRMALTLGTPGSLGSATWMHPWTLAQCSLKKCVSLCVYPAGSSIAQRRVLHMCMCAPEDTGSLIFSFVIAGMFSSSFPLFSLFLLKGLILYCEVLGPVHPLPVPCSPGLLGWG